MKTKFKKFFKNNIWSVALVLPTRPPDYVIKGFRMEETREQKKFIEMVAPEAELYKKEQIARVKHPDSKFFRNDLKSLDLTASEALAHLENHNVLFKGVTDIKSPDGFKIQGRNVEYNHEQKTISTLEPIQFECTEDVEDALIQGWGSGFEADLNAKSFYLRANVNINFIPKDPKASPSKIKGDSLRVFSERGWAQLEGNVAFQNQNLNLRSDILAINFRTSNNPNVSQRDEAIFQSLSNSRVVSFFDNYKMTSKEVTLTLKNRKDIERVIAKGDVVISDNNALSMTTDSIEIINPQSKQRKMKLIGKVNIKKNGDTAKSQEAFYDPKTDDLMLKGEASFRRGKDTLSGHEIKYSQSKGILQVFKASGQMQKSRLNGTM